MTSERIAGAALFDDELTRLVRAREAADAQRSTLQALESARARLESGLAEASHDIQPPGLWAQIRVLFGESARHGDAEASDIESILAQLQAIERDRAQLRAQLDASTDLEPRFDYVIARKHEQLMAAAPEHPVSLEIAHTFERMAALRSELSAIDRKLLHAEDALGHLRLLIARLNEIEAVSLVDSAINVQPLEIVFAVSKHSRMREARGHAERAARSLQALGAGSQADRVRGPHGPAGLSDFEVALIDGLLGGAADAALGTVAYGWRRAARDCHERLPNVIGSLRRRRRALEIELSERTRDYQLLVLHA